MADEMQAYNKSVEKICTDCAADVFKLISNCRSAVSSRMGKLAADIEKLEVPSSGDPSKVPDLVQTTLKKGGTKYSSIATFGVKVTVSGKKVSVPAAGISGPLAGVV